MTTPKKQPDPKNNIIVIGDDGQLYQVTEDVWKSKPVTDTGGQGVLNQLKEFGVYLAYIPPDIAVGFGEICVVVNMEAIRKNNP